MNIFSKLKQRYSVSGERSKKSLINILLSFGAKGITIITQLMIVPLTINYVNSTQYGIWLTLSSIIAWIGFFDLGFGNGMRNKVAEAKAKDNIMLAKQYVSTTYFAIGLMVVALLLLIEFINVFIDWSTVLKVDISYNIELCKVFAALTAFFCLDMVAKLFKSLLQAEQMPGIASLIDVCGQLLSLVTILLLTKFSEGSLLRLAIFYSGIPALTLLFVSSFAFRFTYFKEYAPHISYVRKYLIKDIMNIGIQFFVIYICMLVIFQIINVVISRELGPDSVTEYNIAHKYFNIAHSVMIIILSPFWSAYTDAYHKKDYQWMKKAKRLLERIWICEVFAVIIMVMIAPWFYKMWIGGSVSVKSSLTIGMALFLLAHSIGAVYMYMINGIGKIRVQLIVYVVFALISLPMMLYSCRALGLLGILIAPTIVYTFQAILGRIQIDKILSGNCTGIWNK